MFGEVMVLISFARSLVVRFFILSFCFSSVATAQDITLLPKFGNAVKTDQTKAAEGNFLKGLDEEYKGDRKKASQDIATGGWQFLGKGDFDSAMRRFNQAWLADSSNGVALWGMGVVLANTDKGEEGLKLFAEAETLIGKDVNFAVDYAKVLGIAGAQTGKAELTRDAFARFAALYERAPQNTPNLQNWAITLFYAADYAEAWKKIKLAEATPRSDILDPSFIAALQSKMPRP
jgi:tetratricopeptide (TPR) repeat protein